MADDRAEAAQGEKDKAPAENRAVCVSDGDPLPLGYRYQAAWSEQCTRISLRQEVIQIYLAAAVLLFGFWVTAHTSSSSPQIADSLAKKIQESVGSVDSLLTVGTTALTCFAASLVIIHNTVIRKLTEFMAQCEWHARDSIWRLGEQTNDLFNFGDPDYLRTGEIVHKFHRSHRERHRLLIAMLVAATSSGSFFLTWTSSDPYRKWCIAASALAVGTLFLQWARGIFLRWARGIIAGATKKNNYTRIEECDRAKKLIDALNSEDLTLVLTLLNFLAEPEADKY